MPANSARKILALMTIVSIALSGCSTVRVPAYPVQPFEAQTFFGSTNELAIAATPMSDTTDITRYFGTDLTKHGVFPVYVVVRNVSSHNVYIVADDAFEVRKKTTNVGTTSNDLDATKNGKGIRFAGGILGAPLVILAGAKLLSDEKVIEQNFKRNKFPTDTLSPRDEGSGFIYFPIPEDGITGHWFLALTAKEISTGDLHSVRLEFDITEN